MTHLKITRNSTSTSITQCPGTFITNPSMNTTSTRIKPGHMLKSKILLQSCIHNLHRHRHHIPTFATNIRSCTSTSTHAVIIRQIDIEHQLTLHGVKRPLRGSLKGKVILGWVREDRADINFVGISFLYGLNEFCLRDEGLVTDVNLFPRYRFNGKGELTVCQGVGRG